MPTKLQTCLYIHTFHKPIDNYSTAAMIHLRSDCAFTRPCGCSSLNLRDNTCDPFLTSEVLHFIYRSVKRPSLRECLIFLHFPGSYTMADYDDVSRN